MSKNKLRMFTVLSLKDHRLTKSGQFSKKNNLKEPQKWSQSQIKLAFRTHVSFVIAASNSSEEFFFSDLFGMELAMPEWEALLTIISLILIIIITVIGNILVIISVFTHTPLKITPNYFIVSLAMADLTVSICVLPFNIVHTVLGRWVSILYPFVSILYPFFIRLYPFCIHFIHFVFIYFSFVSM